MCPSLFCINFTLVVLFSFTQFFRKQKIIFPSIKTEECFTVIHGTFVQIQYIIYIVRQTFSTIFVFLLWLTHSVVQTFLLPCIICGNKELTFTDRASDFPPPLLYNPNISPPFSLLKINKNNLNNKRTNSVKKKKSTIIVAC